MCFSKKKNNYKIYSSGGLIKDKPHEIEKDILLASKIKHKGFKIRAGLFSWKSDKKKIQYAKKLTKKFNMCLMVDMIMGTIEPSNNYSFYKNKINFLSEMKLQWLEEPFHPDNAKDLLKLEQEKVRENLDQKKINKQSYLRMQKHIVHD